MYLYVLILIFLCLLFFCQIDTSDSKVDFDSIGAYTIEPEAMSRSPFDSFDSVESRPACAGM
jgi:hypothetical protein